MTQTYDLTSLAASFRGTIHDPSTSHYDDARRVWNGQVNRHPAIIATCSDTADVAAAVRFAVAENMPLSVRAGGHHVAGSAIVEGGIVIDLAEMNGVKLDPDTGRVRVQGGAKLGDLDRGTLPFGYLTPAGIDHDTGVGGLTLGGGVGWTMRKYGLTCDNLTAVSLVTANGEIVRATDESHPDLMWGLRGGGGNFGVVTEFEFTAHPVAPTVVAGFVIYHGDDAVEVLRGYRDAVAEAPDDLTTIVFLRIAPPVAWIPADLVGQPIVMIGAVWLGDPDAGEAVVGPLRTLAQPLADTLGPKPMLEHQGILEGANPVGDRYYWKSAPIADLTDPVIDLLDQHLRAISSPLSLLGFFQLGGAVARGEGLGAFPSRDARFLINYAVHWVDETEDASHRDWTRAAIAEIEPHAIGGGYVNFLTQQGTDALRAVYGRDRFDRLVALKDRFDPNNVFRHNQNIPPSRH